MNTEKLINVVESLPYSKANLCRRCGFSIPTLQRMLSGQDFKVSNLETLCRVLNIPVGEFFDGFTANIINNHGTNSAATYSGTINHNHNDSDKSESYERIIAEKDNVISSLHDLINEKERVIRVYEKIINK